MGNFDGLHRGHAVLIGRTCELAREAGRPTGVLTFEPHPRSVFFPAAEPFRLTPFRVKERELARLGIDLLFVQHFDLAFSKKSAEEFIAESSSERSGPRMSWSAGIAPLATAAAEPPKLCAPPVCSTASG